MTNNMLETRILALIVLVTLWSAFLFCQTSPAAQPLLPTPNTIPKVAKVTPTSSPTLTPIPTAIPAPPTFEDTLASNDLAKFQSLPQEFKDGLNYVAESTQHPRSPFTSHEKALEFLRALPEDVQPISDVLRSETLDVFYEVNKENRTFLLLDVYSRTFGTNEFYPDSPELERQVHLEGFFEGMVRTVYEMEFGDGEVNLPPMEEALSADALQKLDDVDPLIRRAFLLIWLNRRMPEEERNYFVTNLESALISVPLKLPPVEELGLSQSALVTLSDVQNLKTFVEEYVAASLAKTGKLDSMGTETLESIIERASTPEGSRMFAQGLLPVTTDRPLPLISHFWPDEGFWPLWAIPPFFRKMQPGNLVAEWPDHEQVLSQEALAKLDSLDAPLQEAFEKYWYGTGPLPNDVHWMAGVVLRWERDLRALPFDTLPQIEDILSEDDIAMYRRLDPSSRNVVDTDIAYGVLYGRVWLEDTQESVYAYNTTPDEFLDALKTSILRTVRGAARTIFQDEVVLPSLVWD